MISTRAHFQSLIEKVNPSVVTISASRSKIKNILTNKEFVGCWILFLPSHSLLSAQEKRKMFLNPFFFISWVIKYDKVFPWCKIFFLLCFTLVSIFIFGTTSTILQNRWCTYEWDVEQIKSFVCLDSIAIHLDQWKKFIKEFLFLGYNFDTCKGSKKSKFFSYTSRSVLLYRTRVSKKLLLEAKISSLSSFKMNHPFSGWTHLWNIL